MLASRFGSNAPVLYSSTPLSDDQIRRVAPSIFADHAHASRSERYSYIATATVLAGLRKEGFEPFMVAQTRVRDEGRREYTKHMMRLRHATRKADQEAVDEVILLNSHDGTSAYQMLAGSFRFVCKNGLVCGDVVEDVRIKHSGNAVNGVIQGAYDVLDGFDLVREVRDDMRRITLDQGEQQAYAKAVLEFRYEPSVTKPAPITEDQLLRPRRVSDQGSDLWTTFNRVQENVMRGGLDARTRSNRRTSTRAVQGIDQGVKLNRAMWVLADAMRKHKG